VCEELKSGARDFQRMDRQAMTELSRHGWQPDYVAVRRQADLHPPTELDHDLVVLAAARLGRTRLIDNVELSLSR
jgi:pantoate--beta-alanine ligase